MNQVKFSQHCVLIILSATLLCPSAQARVILGVSGGQSGLSSDLARSVQAKDKQSKAGFVTLGYQLTPPWSVNVRYGVLMDETIANGQTVKLTTGAILHRYDFLPASRWDVYGMVGVSYNEQRVSGKVSGAPLSGKKVLKRISPVGGFGVGYHMTPRQSLGVEAVMYTKDTWAGILEYRYRFPNQTIENAPDWQVFAQKFERKNIDHQAKTKLKEASSLVDSVASESASVTENGATPASDAAQKASSDVQKSVEQVDVPIE